MFNVWVFFVDKEPDFEGNWQEWVEIKATRQESGLLLGNFVPSFSFVVHFSSATGKIKVAQG